MKTFVLQLEGHDDYISTRDKLTWSKARRILLIWPAHGNVLSRKLDLVLVNRACQRMGAQLALVTDRPDTIDAARDLGIPVFQDAGEAQNRSWRRTRRKRATAKPIREPLTAFQLREKLFAFRAMKQNSILRIFAFGIGILAMTALVLFFIPQAVVTLKLPEKDQSVTLQIQANPQVTSPSVSGEVPAQIVSVIVEAEDQISSSGLVLLPGQVAKGLVRFSNLTDEPVSIPTGTVVTTLGDAPLRFEVTKALEVPAGIGQAVDVPVQSLDAGSKANVPVGEIVAVEGPIGLVCSVYNFESPQGGSDQSVPLASAGDYLTLRARLLDTLAQAALQELSSSIGTEDVLVKDTLKQEQVVSESRTPPEGQPGDQLTLRIQGKYSAWVIRKGDVDMAVVKALSISLPPKWTEVTNSLVVEWINQPELKDGQVQWEVYALRNIQPDWDRAAIRQLIAGKNLRSMPERLVSQLGLEELPIIHIRPSWWPWMPFLPYQIQVENR